MTGHGGPTSQKPPQSPTNGAVVFGRIAQACLVCRRKKVKCDGQTPCHNCGSRSISCEYPPSNDNASTSRQYTQAFEDRFQHLERLCAKLEGISNELSQSLAAVNHLTGTNQPDQVSPQTALREVAETLQSLPRALDGPIQPPVPSGPLSVSQEGPTRVSPQEDAGYRGTESDSGLHLGEDMIGSIDDDSDDDDVSPWPDQAVAKPRGFGSLVTDSYGRLRFLGGAMNHVLIEAVQSLSPCEPSTASPFNETPNSTKDGSLQESSTTNLELPIFIHGQRWPELPQISQSDIFTRPPQYIADHLVTLYFDQLHFTFPVLYQPQFMRRYKQITSSRTHSMADRKFLSVFYAVCACASSLLPSDGRSGTFPGLEYYQKSLILLYASTGEASIERVQCLALLAMCSGGWNTLTQSWNFAGQAVRAAQDLGMHLSNLNHDVTHSTGLVGQQLSRRIWWSVYCLDRITSICLGRPMAAHDEDCHCELPLSVADAELEDFCQNPESLVASPPTTSSPLSGFLEFARLCQIAGKIQRLYSPSRVLTLDDPRRTRQLLRSVGSLQKALDDWLASLPDESHFSAGNGERGPNLTMRVIMFIVHAGSLLNLYRSISINGLHQRLNLDSKKVVSHCVDAARSCINAAEFVRELVPPSRHLAFCVYYLILSGLILMRMPEYPREEAIPDVKKCIRFLEGLEMTWSGARKGRAILESLLQDPGQKKKRSRAEFEADSNFLNAQVPGLEVFGYEFFDLDLFNSYLM